MSSSPARRAAKAARYELAIIAFKCKLILTAYPDDGTEITRLRFCQGLGRELWRAIHAVGMLDVMQRNVPEPDRLSLPANSVLNALFEQISWMGMNIMVDVDALDRKALLQLYAEADEPAIALPSSLPTLGAERWWEWVAPGGQDEMDLRWWREPQVPVGRPMPTWPVESLNFGGGVQQIIAIAAERHEQVQSMQTAEKEHRRHATKALIAQRNVNRADGEE